MSSDARDLASWLTSLDDDALRRVLHTRRVSPTAAWRDFFDAAEALLDPTAVERAIAGLDQRALADLTRAAAGQPVPASVQSYAFTRTDGAPFAVVAARLTSVTSSGTDAAASALPAAALSPATAEESAQAAERIFTASTSLADVLLAASHVPLTRTGAGPVSANDRKRLLELGAISSADDLDDLVVAAEAARLLAPVEREWVVTAETERWLRLGTPERWGEVAEGLRTALPAGLRTVSGGVVDPAHWAAAYPLDPDWPTRATTWRRTALRWGILTASGTLPPWSVPLAEGRAADLDALRPALPAEIDRIYLQADLTAVAPGPLSPPLDLRLRTIARRESRAQASTYRFTAESIGAGLTEGETAESIREFLEQLSLTGIPQPLDYVLTTTAARHGSITVRSDPETGNTLVESSDPHLLELVQIDQALRPVGLVRHGDHLASRVGRDHLFWALADARYPVVALAADGTAASLRRRTAPAGEAGAAADADRYARLIETLRAAGGSDSDAAWLDRELDHAVRARSVIVVTVQMSATEQRTFTLEAAGLGGGRLRGKDKAADVERTLPVSMIVSVRPA